MGGGENRNHQEITRERDIENESPRVRVQRKEIEDEEERMERDETVQRKG